MLVLIFRLMFCAVIHAQNSIRLLITDKQQVYSLKGRSPSSDLNFVVFKGTIKRFFPTQNILFSSWYVQAPAQPISNSKQNYFDWLSKFVFL